MSQSNYVVDTLISAKSIAARIEHLAKEIQSEFKETDKLIVVGLLRGSFVFIADLVRELNLPVEVDFLEASSYGDEMVSSKEVRILKDLRGAIEGKDVLLVEDIVDTGFTLHHVTNLLLSRSPAKLKNYAQFEPYIQALLQGQNTYLGINALKLLNVINGATVNESGSLLAWDGSVISF